MPAKRQIFTGMQIVTEDQVLNAHALVVQGTSIQAIILRQDIKRYLPAKVVEFSAD
jgi:hypothetical protein